MKQIKYLCINQPVKRYKIFQTLYVIIGVILTVCSFIILRQSKIWYLKYLWLVWLFGTAGEIVETVVALRWFVREDLIYIETPEKPHLGQGLNGV